MTSQHNHCRHTSTYLSLYIPPTASSYEIQSNCHKQTVLLNNNHSETRFTTIYSTSNPTMSSNQNTQQPGLVAGHAQYVKGAAEVPFPPLNPFSLAPPNKPTHTSPGDHRQRYRQPSMASFRRAGQSPSRRRHEGRRRAQRSQQGLRWCRGEGREDRGM